MSYGQALEAQLHLAQLYDKAESEEGLLSELGRGVTGVAGRGQDFAMLTRLPLLMGECFYWSSSMCALLERATGSLEDWQCDPSILLCSFGFCWFSDPICIDGSSPIRALGWAPIFETGEDRRKMVPMAGSSPEMLDGVGIVFYLARGEDRWPYPGALFVLPRGESIRTAAARVEGRYDTVGPLGKLATFVAAMSLISQRILTANPQRPDRAVRRRLEREGFKHEPLVRVVELRRRQARSDQRAESDPVAWSHQWIVSGHWRQQWYPSLNANQPRWIMPFVKGPPDKPLKPPRAKVFAVVR